MYAATAGGTRPSSDSRRAARPRIAVDETLGVSTATSMMRGVEGTASSAGSIMRSARAGTRPRSVSIENPGRATTTKWASVENLRIAVPGGNFCERVGPGDEENLRRRQAVAIERRERVVGITTGRGVAAPDRKPPIRRRRDGEPDHLYSMILRRLWTVRAMWRAGGWNEPHAVQGERLLSRPRRGKMAVMNRIERAAEQAHRRAPGHRLREPLPRPLPLTGGTRAGL